MTWRFTTTSLLPNISVNLMTHHVTIRSSVVTFMGEHMEGKALLEMMTSQIVSPAHNPCSQGCVCLSPATQMGLSALLRQKDDPQREGYYVGSLLLVQSASHKC